MSGVKHDKEKPPVDLVPYEAVEEIARVLAFGAEKYGSFNWTKGIEFRRLIAAAQRHIGAYNSGEDTDEESGLNHLAHAGCCIAFLLWMQKHRPDLDNRGFKKAVAQSAAIQAINENKQLLQRLPDTGIEVRKTALYESRSKGAYRIIRDLDHDGTFLGKNSLTGDERWFYKNGAHAYGVPNFDLVKEITDAS